MSSLVYLSSFGSQALHNGTTHKSMGMIPAGGRVEDVAIRMPNGTLYDPYGGNAPVIPQPFTSQLMLIFASSVALTAEFEALVALKGTSDTLIATKMTSGTLTCTAYLLDVRDNDVEPTELGINRRIELDWRPLGGWA